MHILLIIFDGLADRPAPELDGKTPLEAARTPNLDRLAAEGINGLLHPKSPGYPLGSPLALHLMFGYPEAEFPDRGPLLATARGIEIAPTAISSSPRASPPSKPSLTDACACSSASSATARTSAARSRPPSPSRRSTA